MTSDEDRRYGEQVEIFERLYDRVDQFIGLFGRPDTLLGLGDYSIYGDYWGYPQLKLSVGKLELLRPHLIKGLQDLLKEFPGWEIVVAVAIEDHFYDWPEMGLTIRANEIIDGLQRRYFPKEFQGLEYEGSRRGPVA